MSGRTLLPRQRQDVIQDLLRARRFATVRELADAVGVSQMTVRRDLEALESGGRVRRVFGGAQATPAPGAERVPEQRYSERMMANRAAKSAIGRAAAAMVEDGRTVALDGSTTAVYLAHELRDRDVTIVTNNLLVVNELAGGSPVVYLSGGTVRAETRTLVGDGAVRSLAGYNADFAFFSCTGLHADAGISDSNAEEVAVKRALFELARRRVALVDGSKFGRVSLHDLIDPADVEAVVSDARPDRPLLCALEEHGVALRWAHG